MAKIRMLVPQYVKEFQCIGGECEDTCCKIWNITVDKGTYKKYKRLKKDEFKPLSDKNIVKIKEAKNKFDYAKICLKEDGSCPFLNEEGLCNIYSKLSYEYMPLTCRIYPRMINEIDGVQEMSLSLSCPEAARKALLSKQIMEFEFVEFDMEEYMQWKTHFLYTQGVKVKKAEHRYFWDIRMAAIDILQNRNFSISHRLMLLGMMYQKIEHCIGKKEYENIPVQIDRFLETVNRVKAEDLFYYLEQNKAIQLFISKMIIEKDAIASKKGVSQKLSELMLGAQRAFETSEENVYLDIEVLDEYNRCLEEEINPFIKEHHYIIENYLVNLYFMHCMPFLSIYDNIWESLVFLCMQYLMIKILMIGNFYNKQRITVEDVIEIIYLIGRNFEHNEKYVSLILEINKTLELDTLGGLYILIHD